MPSRRFSSAGRIRTFGEARPPDGDTSRLISTVLRNRPQPMTSNLGFASAVAEFGMLLRGSKLAGAASYESAIERAREFRDDDRDGYRSEFIKLVDLADGLRKFAHAENGQ